MPVSLTAALWCLAAATSLPAATLPVMDAGTLPPPLTRSVDFVRDIRPLLDAHCLKCHGPEKQKGGYRLDWKNAAFKGGEYYGPATARTARPDSTLNALSRPGTL